MDTILGQFLQSKNLGALEFDPAFHVVSIDDIAMQIINALGFSRHEDDVLSLFPELIGTEDFIQQIIATQTGDYRLDYINRTDKNGQEKYLNLVILSNETPQRGLLIIEDITNHAQALREFNQQRYDLFLYQRNQEFRRKFLSNSLLGNSAAIQNIRDSVQKLSTVPNATVLLLGETGTGKNLTARIIHHSVMPTDAPFVHINCAALPEHLIESELFGYEKGAFTHAITARPGLFEEAFNGTIFLDEIGEMSMNIQAKLLAVLETKKVRRLGSNKSIDVNARVIAATNKDLQKGLKQKTFREDLYYRLNVVQIQLPPLRDLGDDVLLIAEHLLKLFNTEFNKQVKCFSEDAKAVLVDYSWPGNVRELSNCIERAMIFIEKDIIEPEDLTISHPAQTLSSQTLQQITIPPGGIVLEELERQYIVAALEKAGNNKSKAARLLGLSRDTLRYRLEKHHLA
ncbi:MAG: sigma-54 dependent transcriptional regulator [Desulfobacterales bacterium]|jgi:transcriptional regulator with PAS, ATPase and Fis domain